MSVITVSLLGRLANQTLAYLYARAMAEQRGCTFECDSWIGSKVWQLDDPPTSDQSLPRYCEENVPASGGDFCLRTYAQHQKALLYSRADVRRWLRWRPEILKLIREHSRSWLGSDIVGHLRRDDYGALGYPLVSRASYMRACSQYGYNPSELMFVSDEFPFVPEAFAGDLEWLPDFWRMTQARVLFRANSSFSFLSALLCDGRIFSPRIDGRGDGEHEVAFENGNHCKLSERVFCSDLHVREI